MAYSFFLIGIFILLILLISIFLVCKFKWGIYFLAFIVPFAADHIGLHVKSTWSNKMADIIPVFTIISPVILIGLIFQKLTGLHNWRVNNLIIRLLFLFLCWAAITLFWAFNFEHNLLQLFILTNNFLIFYLLLNSIDNVNFQKNLMWCWIMFGVLAMVGVFVAALFDFKKIYSIEIGEWLTFKFILFGCPNRPLSVANPNETSFILNLTTCVAIGMLLTEDSFNKKVLLFMIVILMIFANIITLSKGGLFGMLAMLYFLLFFIQKFRRNLVRNFILMHLLLILFLVFQITTTLESLPPRLVSSTESSSLKSRIKDFYKPCMKRLMESNLFKGMGVGTAKDYLTPKAGGAPHAHSIYFSTLFDFGIVGFAIASVIFIIFLKDFLNILKFPQTKLHVMFLCCCGGLVAIFVHGAIDFEYNTPEIWFFFGLTVVTLNLAKHELNYLQSIVNAKNKLTYNPLFSEYNY